MLESVSHSGAHSLPVECGLWACEEEGAILLPGGHLRLGLLVQICFDQNLIALQSSYVYTVSLFCFLSSLQTGGVDPGRGWELIH